MLPRHIVHTLAADGWLAAHPANMGATTELSSPAQNIVVLSASKAARWQPSSSTAVISIRGAANAETPLSLGYRAVVRLVFDDTSAFANAGPDAVTILPTQAAAVAAFVRANADADTLLIHCEAGVSRSRSMAAAICDVMGLPYRWTVLNADVYNAVRAALQRDCETPPAHGS